MESIRELFDFMTREYSTITALKWPVKNEVREKSYRELGEDVHMLRRGLCAEELENTHIAIVGFSSALWLEAYFAITTGNNAAVLIDPLLPEEEIIDLLQRSDSEAVFLDSKKADMADKIRTCCPLIRKVYELSEDTFFTLKKEGEVHTDAPGNQGDSLAMIIFTSGTTGKSKGVMLTHRNLISNVEAVKYDSEPGRVVLSVLPIHHAYCLVMDYLKTMSLGTTVCINDSLLHTVRNMQLFRPQIMLMVPMMLETIYKKLSVAGGLMPKKLVAAKVFGGRLQTVFCGGAHLDPFYIEKLAEYGVKVYEGYGMSECSPVISMNTPECNRAGSVGKVLNNAYVKFKDGEILVRGSSVMAGYYHMPAETAEALEQGWLYTGDKGYMDEDGFLFINGRVKNLIILSNGENVSPEEIENKLALNRLVEEVVVTGDGNGLTARIYPDLEYAQKKKLDREKVEKELQKILDEYNKVQPSYRRIVHLVVRENPFKRNTTKKILRQFATEDVAS
jgi:long-chain acyl-CoA synthetase